MKRAIILLLVLAMMLGLCACGKTDEPESQTNAPAVETPKTDKNAPSGELIRADLEEALAEKDPHAALTGMEITKSLTDESSYEATLTLTAQTRYADWTYETDVSYTKYDQGWMVDDIDFIDESYVLERVPSDEDMTELVNTFFTDHDDYRLNDLAPISNGKINDNVDIQNEVVVFSWDKEIQYLHGTDSSSYCAQLRYNSKQDDWAVMEEENPSSYIYGGYEIWKSHEAVYIQSDLSGDWTLNDGSAFTISNFDGITFSADWNGKHYEFSSQVAVPYGFDTSNSNEFWYGDPSRDIYLNLKLIENSTVISIFKKTSMIKLIGMGSIKEVLPDLGA